MINVLSPSFLISSFITASLGFWIVSLNPRNRTYLSWFLFCLSVALWSFGLGVLSIVKDRSIADIFYFIHYFGAINIPVTFLYFVRVYFLRDKSIRLDVIFGILLSTAQLILFFAGQLVAPLTPKWKFTFYTNPGNFYLLFMAYFFCYVLYAFYLMIRSTLFEKAIYKRRKIFFIIATGLGYLGGSSAFFMVYDVNFPPYGIILFFLFPIITTYAIIRHQLMDIEVIIKKTLVFAGLFAMVMAIVAIVTTLTQGLIGQYFNLAPFVSTALSVFIAILLYDPARKLLVNVTDKFLFQKKEDIKTVLNRLSQNIITILDIEQLGKTILLTLAQLLRLESGVIILKEENNDTYRILDAFGIRSKSINFKKDDGLIRFFSEYQKMVNLESPHEKKHLSPALEERLKELNAVIAIPLYVHIDLIGVLTLGKKKSDQEFSREEIDYLPVLAGQAAIALSNARLYDILKKSQIDFAQQAKMATIGTLSAGISHEIKNPLNHIKVGIDMLRINKKHGVLDNLNRQQLEDEIFKTLNILSENVDRANGVIEKLSSFAKKPKELKIEPVNLEKAMDLPISFLQKEFDHYNVKIEKDFRPNLPEIQADLHSFEDVFLNLLVNARHAIGQGGQITIKGYIEGNDLKITIQDTGKGIPPENIDKIFDPFFTTKDVSRNPDKNAVKGSGLGLFIVREIIQRFGGRIHVESEVGRGTIFYVIFPNTTWVKGG